ncbi:MAG: VOC family protein [Betaproteobacteria bacterium]|nr:VOC family protein [Betaproteobacteria bacterium]
MTETTALPHTGTRASGAQFVRGVHHLVLTTEDMKMTIDFYTEVLGMPLIHALKVQPGLGTGKDNRGNPPFENLRHYFFDMGNDSLLAFFEMPRGAKEKSDRDAIGGMQHVSFVVRPRAQYDALMARLTARGIAYRGPSRMASGPGYSIYFYDPNGVRLEASCDTTGDEPLVVRDATQTRAKVLDELRTLCDDEAWLARVTAHLQD